MGDHMDAENLNLCESDSEFSEEESDGNGVVWKDINTGNINVNAAEISDASNQVHSNYFSEQARTSFNLFRIAHVYVTRIPHEITKYRRVRHMTHSCRRSLLMLFDTVVKRLAHVLFPVDGRGLFSEYCAKKSSEGKLVRRMVNILRKVRNGSVEKRVIRACLFSSVQGRALYEMMTNGMVDMDVETLETGGRRGEDSDSDQDGTFVDGQQGSPGNDNSGEGAVSADRTTMVRGTNAVAVRRDCTGGHGQDGLLSRTSSVKTLSGGFQRLQRASRTDWMTLVATGGLMTERRYRSHFSDDVLVRMLSFLFRADNVQLLSWGTKRVVYGGQVHRFPAVVRRTSGEGLWRRFNEEMGVGNSVRRVGRTVFRAIVAYLTKGQLEARSCIDYYQDSLINENVKLLKEIVRKECDPHEDHSTVVNRLDAIAGFLKYSYRNHLQYNCHDGYHDINHALLKGCVLRGTPANKKTSTCKLCLCAGRIVKDIGSMVVSNNPSVSVALEQSALRFQLYMGHCIRAKVQQDKIAAVMEVMKMGPAGRKCVIYVDFKMKQLPKKLRESSQDWFGKKGMSWHGAAVFFKRCEIGAREMREQDLKLQELRTRRKGKRSCKKVVHVEGPTGSEPEMGLFFIDSVLEDAGTQDTMTTASVMDAICVRLRRELPELEEVVLVSDNASNYANLTMPLITYYIMKSHSLRLLEILHPDAQQSKNMVDAHFGIGSRQIDKYIREKDLAVMSPEDIAEALIYDGGIKSTAVDFVRVNRNSVRVRKWFDARDDKKSKKFDSIGTCGDIMFHDLGNGGVHVTTEKYSGAKSSHYVMEEYSILSGGEDGEAIVQGAINNANSNGSSGGVDVMTGDGVRAESEVGTSAAQNSEANMQDDMTTTAEVNDIADGIAGGAENRCRRDGDKVPFSQRSPIGITPYTGAAIKYMSTIQYWDRRVYLDCREAFADAQAEIEAEEEGLTTDAEERRNVVEGQAMGPQVQPAEVPSDTRLEGMTGNREGGLHRCHICNRAFRREQSALDHQRGCESGTRTVRQSTLCRAAELASKLVYEGSIEHDIIYNPQGNCFYMDEMDLDTVADAKQLDQGWAERPAEGSTIGENNEPRYRPLVDKWIKIGEQCKERQMTAAVMQRTIRVMFPRNYDFPSERHLKNRIVSRAGAVKRKNEKEERERAKTEKEQRERQAVSAQGMDEDIAQDTADEARTGLGTGRTVSNANDDDDGEQVGLVMGEGQQPVGELNGCRQDGALRLQPLPEIGGYIRPPGVPSGHVVPSVPEATGDLRQGQPTADGVEIESSAVEGEGDGPAHKPAIRQGVAMSRIYADAIIAILGEEPGIKRTEVYGKLVTRLCLEEGNLPLNFPTADQVRNKVSNFRRSAGRNDGGPSAKRRRKA